MERKQRLTHGTLAGYKTYRCRCKRCTEVWNLYIQEFRDNIFDETKAAYKDINPYLIRDWERYNR